MADEQFIIFPPWRSGIRTARLRRSMKSRGRPNISRALPKAPAFVDGVMNLRGIGVPIVDLRRRFDITSKEPVDNERVLVLAIGGGKTGFMVDSVSEVL